MTGKTDKLVGLNVTVDHSPKVHPEIAGGGIACTYANAKYYLRIIPIGKRETAKQFMGQVRLALATNKGLYLSRNKIQHFSARVQDYIGAYHYPQNFASPVKRFSSKITTLSMKDIERMKKMYCLHRGVERCDMAWCGQKSEVANVANAE
eukprot:1024188-Ditylum_brightwellii.AAC.1